MILEGFLNFSKQYLDRVIDLWVLLIYRPKKGNPPLKSLMTCGSYGTLI